MGGTISSTAQSRGAKRILVSPAPWTALNQGGVAKQCHLCFDREASELHNFETMPLEDRQHLRSIEDLPAFGVGAGDQQFAPRADRPLVNTQNTN